MAEPRFLLDDLTINDVLALADCRENEELSLKLKRQLIRLEKTALREFQAWRRQRFKCARRGPQ